MKLNLHESPLNSEVKILDIEGHIDNFTDKILEEELFTLLKIGTNKVVCNLSLVEFIGTAGLKTFLCALKQARLQKGDLKLCGLQDTILKSFEFAGFGDTCVFYQDVNEAVRDFGGYINGPVQELALTEEEMYDATQFFDAAKVQQASTEDDWRAPTVQLSQRQNFVNPEEATVKLDNFDKRPSGQLHKALPEPTQNYDGEAGTGKAKKDTSKRTGTSVVKKNIQPELSPEMEKTISQKIATLHQQEVKEETTKRSQEKCFSYHINYYIRHKIAEGNLGKLYFGEEKSAYGFCKPVAIKYIKTQHSFNKETMGILLQEVRKAYTVTHQNIAQIYQLTSWNDYYFLVMEYIDGITLAEVLKQLQQHNRIIPPNIASFMIYALCVALSYANRKVDKEGTQLDIFHGKIHADNVMLSKDGDVKLLSLGIAKTSMMLQLQDRKTLDHIEYVAPEVLRLGMPTKLGDIFSIGVLFYEILTGRKPFTAEQAQGKAGNSLFPTSYLDDINPPSYFNKKISDITDRIVLRCMAADPERRFQDFQDIALQLEERLHEKGFSLTQVSLNKFLENNKFW